MAWIDEHWTHYNWRWDVAELAHRVENLFATAANTYNDHPTGQGLDAVSVDFWSPWGRGSDIDTGVGFAIVNYVWNDPNPPWIRWYIWQGWEYDVPYDWIGSGNYISYPYEDPFDQHFDHVHFTFW